MDQTIPLHHADSYPIPDEVANFALHHYETVLPRKGKPQTDREFSVYACIIAALPLPLDSSHPCMWAVSCATGSKCCAVSSSDLGRKLHDSHAEVLARRGFVRQLWLEVQSSLKRISSGTHKDAISQCNTNPQRLLDLCESDEHDNICFQLRIGLKLMCYISDSPCGDAAIYQTTSTNLTFTGAKVIVSEKTGVTMEQCIDKDGITCNDVIASTPSFARLSTSDPSVVVARECTQICGALRLKSGRSNIPDHLRSTSHSCSDKFCRWAVLGLQGSLLNRWIKNPIVFHSVVVSADPRCNNTDGNPQQLALRRAINERTSAAINFLTYNIKQKSNIADGIRQAALRWIDCIDQHQTSVHIVARQFPQGKAFVESSSQLSRSALQQENKDKREGEREAKRGKFEKIGFKKFSAAGISLNWQPIYVTLNGGDCIELTVGASGRKQGKKPKSSQDFDRCSSRLCRKKILDVATSCSELHPSIDGSDNDTEQSQHNAQSNDSKVEMTFAQFKKRNTGEHVRLIRELLFSGGPLAGWVTGTSCDFTICHVAE